MLLRFFLGVVAITLLLIYSQKTFVEAHQNASMKVSELISEHPAPAVNSDDGGNDGDSVQSCAGRLVKALLCGALLSFQFLPVSLGDNGARTCDYVCPSTLDHDVPQSHLEFPVLKNEPTLPAVSFDSFSKLEELGQRLTVGVEQCYPRDRPSQTHEDSGFCPLEKNSLSEEEELSLAALRILGEIAFEPTKPCESINTEKGCETSACRHLPRLVEAFKRKKNSMSCGKSLKNLPTIQMTACRTMSLKPSSSQESPQRQCNVVQQSAISLRTGVYGITESEWQRLQEEFNARCGVAASNELLDNSVLQPDSTIEHLHDADDPHSDPKQLPLSLCADDARDDPPQTLPGKPL